MRPYARRYQCVGIDWWSARWLTLHLNSSYRFLYCNLCANIARLEILSNPARFRISPGRKGGSQTHRPVSQIPSSYSAWAKRFQHYAPLNQSTAKLAYRAECQLFGEHIRADRIGDLRSNWSAYPYISTLRLSNVPSLLRPQVIVRIILVHEHLAWNHGMILDFSDTKEHVVDKYIIVLILELLMFYLWKEIV
jgi:hypothetical protein